MPTRMDTTLLGRQRGRRKRRGFLLGMSNLVANTEPNSLEPLFSAKLLPQRPFPPLLMFRKLESLTLDLRASIHRDSLAPST